MVALMVMATRNPKVKKLSIVATDLLVESRPSSSLLMTVPFPFSSSPRRLYAGASPPAASFYSIVRTISSCLLSLSSGEKPGHEQAYQ